ncbi:hypothetical protein L9F63_018626 [Diploptera punctata]|uniref:Major facilitator superfamily associated domain-containing protein n=1 Tax=Diploptera punctata TaxID=6984 RepID=A0AAD8EF99_DIPPU|nr:hypothetical protein L9F63_018626 [Diploptera punctata]
MQKNQKKYIILKTASNNLVALKILLFCFFGGIGCIFPFLPLHMRNVGLTALEAQIVSAVAPLVALLGPWVVCPLADRMSGLRSNNGRGLRVMLALILLLAGVFYALLLCIPTVTRFDSDHKPGVFFLCGTDDAILQHERCVQPACHSWDPKQIGELYLTNCKYDCDTELAEIGRFDMLEMDPPVTTIEMFTEDGDLGSGHVEPPLEGQEEDYDEDQIHDEDQIENEENTRERRDANETITTIEYEPPHLCYTDVDGTVKCKVYTKYSKQLAINASLYSDEQLNPRGQHCHYKLIGGSGKNFTCRIPGFCLEG